ncbi:hypothetical protein LOTGIDRAFT_137302 [Lottia gigantea]|uniref:Sulfatase N-terminal domain-containing protein n=1 Tax=Lottia gigantea TaxID=225164 RepID=V4B7I4_LOTGI|nr:hypothetical protein LOTGIDRAFT_137302 [Lottia gigantea]ESP03556.1 hypothetical protein LOTGIDRAFT_137302 [Lottia gigantea]
MIATLFYKTDDTEKQTSKQPNIIYIFADDLGYNDVGYHRSEIKTPNIDRLSREGVRLENYYVQPICTPSRSQFMSGRYQIHTGLQHGVIKPSQPNALPTTSPTIAEKLKEVGYTTHAIGKWHLGFYKDKFLPINRGFDTFFGFYTGAEDYFDHFRCFEYCGYDLHNNDSSVFNETGHYSTHLFTERAINIVKSHDQSKPMFLYLAYQAVHSPLQAPRRYIRPYFHIQDKHRRKYAGMVSCLDEGIGNLTDALKEAGMWENTVFVFSTDNGGSIGDGGNNWPLRGWKGSLWEGAMRGVGFVLSSKLKYPGTVNYEFIHVSDWYLTFLKIAGAKRNGTKDMDGFNQWSTISENAPSPRKELLHNIDPLTMKQGKRLYRDTFDNRIRAAIRVNNWKLITGYPGNSSWIPPPHISRHLDPRIRYQSDNNNDAKNIWLFNIADDPYEEIDLSNTHIDIVRSLLDRLLEYEKTAVPIRYPAYDPESNPQKHGGQWKPWK